MNRASRFILWVFLVLVSSETVFAQPPRQRGVTAPKPLFRDPEFDGAADPVVVWNFAERRWYMFYTNRRAKMPETEIDGVSWVHGTKIGIAESRNGAEWTHKGTANIDLAKEFGVKDITYWAPEVIYGNGSYHMYLTIVPGVFKDWSHPRAIVHLTSQNLVDWKYESTLKLASEKVIDAGVTRLLDGTYRMWYNNEPDKKGIYYADSKDLFQWEDKGKVAMAGRQAGEGPQVFLWDKWYWMVVDVWDGLAIYRSEDATNWTRQEKNILQQPGKGADDGVKGQHPFVLALGNKAYIFYFTHPGRVPGNENNGYEQRRSSIQIAELELKDGLISVNRDKPVVLNLRNRQRAQIHDPSTIMKVDGKYYCFSTGMGVQALVSDDLKTWRATKPLFDEPPHWVNDIVPQYRGHFWAPDVIRVRDRYLVYYSVSAFGKRTSAIALASSPTLDPDSPNYKWTDHGIVVQTTEESDHNAIDPGLFLAPWGSLWMTYGSFWEGIKLIELDPTTGKRISADSPTYSLAKKKEIEAPALYYRDGYYYLFVNWGFCCRGMRSTYNIRVGRSEKITGPYLDREGVDHAEGGGTLVLDTNGSAIGPGHASFLEQGDDLLMSYHYYDGNRRGTPQMGINKLTWDSEGWPVVEPVMAYAGTIVTEEN
jgi:beta-xylosidase